ncbi:MAG: DNA-binding protein [Candidatus Thorarchaeota archaeon]
MITPDKHFQRVNLFSVVFIRDRYLSNAMVRAFQTQAEKTIIARLEPGEDILNAIMDLAIKHKIQSGQVSFIGAISKARIGYFDRETREYQEIAIDRDLEVVSGMGNIAVLDDGNVVVHAHLVVADNEGICYGGHLMQDCTVSVTIELIITQYAGTLCRGRDETTGLNLFQEYS